jgi:hypothetical protein
MIWMRDEQFDMPAVDGELANLVRLHKEVSRIRKRRTLKTLRRPNHCRVSHLPEHDYP